ncbi:D-aminoacylase [Candidatus Bipolaricaulota bacterium]|nr:D-aminoacylase [Candidatus Bipolaricaulota bacterium]
MNFNILLTNGRIFDGNGNPWYHGDLGIKDGQIREIDRNPTGQKDAKRTLDLEGKALSPGFIDIHSHSDCNFLADRRAASKIRQGVTTELVGNCGVSAVPFSQELNFSERIFEEIGEIDWNNFAEFFTRLEDHGLPINLGSLVGHGSLRVDVMGYEDREPTDHELDEMKEILDKSLTAGAFGLSTGLYYAPGSYADTEEIVELARVVSDHGGIYTSHIRNEGKELISAVEEAITIGEKADLPVEISHHKAVGKENWGKVTQSLEIIRAARERGVEVTADQYPYNASSTSLSSLLPGWAKQGGREKWLARIQDPKESEKIKEELGSTNEAEVDWSAIKIVEMPDKCNQELLGKSVQEIASERGTDVLQTALDLLLESDGKASQIHFGISEEDIKTVMAQPFVMTCSDGSSLRPEGPLGKGKPHPRSYGTFPRVFGKYVREENVLAIEDAIRKMTSLPAQKIGLKRKGQIREGMDADLVAFSPQEIEDKATFQDPHRYPEGISYVIVNGKIAVENGDGVECSAGRVLKSGKA